MDSSSTTTVQMSSTNTHALATIISAERPGFTSAFPTDLNKMLPPLHRQRRIFLYFIVCSVANTVPKYHGERQLWTMMVKDIPLGLRDAHRNEFIICSIPQCTSHEWQLACRLFAHSRWGSCVRNPINPNQRKQQNHWSSSGTTTSISTEIIWRRTELPARAWRRRC